MTNQEIHQLGAEIMRIGSILRLHGASKTMTSTEEGQAAICMLAASANTWNRLTGGFSQPAPVFGPQLSAARFEQEKYKASFWTTNSARVTLNIASLSHGEGEKRS